MKDLIQEEILTKNGRESRYQVMPLDEDGKPASYYGTDDSPVNRYALINRKNGYELIEELESESYSEASDILMKNVSESNE